MLSCGSAGLADTELNVPGHRLVWNDEFEAPAVDVSKWDVAVGVNAWYQRASDGRWVSSRSSSERMLSNPCSADSKLRRHGTFDTYFRHGISPPFEATRKGADDVG